MKRLRSIKKLLQRGLPEPSRSRRVAILQRALPRAGHTARAAPTAGLEDPGATGNAIVPGRVEEEHVASLQVEEEAAPGSALLPVFDWDNSSVLSETSTAKDEDTELCPSADVDGGFVEGVDVSAWPCFPLCVVRAGPANLTTVMMPTAAEAEAAVETAAAEEAADEVAVEVAEEPEQPRTAPRIAAAAKEAAVEEVPVQEMEGGGVADLHAVRVTNPTNRTAANARDAVVGVAVVVEVAEVARAAEATEAT